MPSTYVARQGEMWDAVAFALWGEERLAWRLMAANPRYRELVFFSGGEVLVVPEISTVATVRTLPPWKRGARG